MNDLGGSIPDQPPPPAPDTDPGVLIRSVPPWFIRISNNEHFTLWLTTFCVFVVIVAVGDFFSLPRTVTRGAAVFYGITYHMPKVLRMLLKRRPDPTRS